MPRARKPANRPVSVKQQEPDKPDRVEGSATLDGPGGDTTTSEGGATMADDATIDAPQEAPQDATPQDAAGQDVNPFEVRVTQESAEGVDPRAVAALAAALEGKPVGTRVDLPQLPDNATYGAAASQADKHRVALRDGYHLLTSARSLPVDSTRKGKDQPHRWSLKLVPWKDADAATETPTAQEAQAEEVPAEATPEA